MSDRVEILKFTCGPFEENPYLVIGPSGRRAMIVDPGLEAEGILDVARDRGVEVGSSRVDLQACKLEYSIVSPK